jgi:hypothetical protein
LSRIKFRHQRQLMCSLLHYSGLKVHHRRKPVGKESQRLAFLLFLCSHLFREQHFITPTTKPGNTTKHSSQISHITLYMYTWTPPWHAGSPAAVLSMADHGPLSPPLYIRPLSHLLHWIICALTCACKST